jgi:DNA-binding Lrp family transcriptional regulator
MPYAAISAVDEQYFPDDKRAVQMILARHAGKANAISSKRIAEMLKLDPRAVREIIAQLVQDGELIGASVDGENGGYYTIRTPEELEETRAVLRARAIKIFERDKALCRAWEKKFGQPLQPLLPEFEVV